ncbi:MAG: SPOR domain-containing protein [Vicinamibacterales bacterium]
MASSDDGVREIQLSGKQLVFLFMAVTVVSVVIFLCGVLVGRGVQAHSTAVTADAAATLDDADTDPTAASPAPADTGGPTKATGLGYQERLEADGPAPETLVTRPPSAAAAATSRPTPEPAATTPAPQAPAAGQGTRAAAPPPAPAADAPLPAALAEPRGDGFAIQVAALSGRAEAEAVATRLKGKGYSAYLMPPLAGQPTVFRVRVGKYKARAEAETVASKLQREERFQPWITR